MNKLRKTKGTKCSGKETTWATWCFWKVRGAEKRPCNSPLATSWQIKKHPLRNPSRGKTLCDCLEGVWKFLGKIRMSATGTAPILPLAPTASVKLPPTFRLPNRVTIEGTLRQGAKGGTWKLWGLWKTEPTARQQLNKMQVPVGLDR